MQHPLAAHGGFASPPDVPANVLHKIFLAQASNTTASAQAKTEQITHAVMTQNLINDEMAKIAAFKATSAAAKAKSQVRVFLCFTAHFC